VNTLVVGDTGTGKTANIEALLDQLAPEYLPFTMNFSNNTTARTAQELLESKLMKRNKNVWGPTGGKARMLTFIDDLNMPRKDEYGTQSSSELLKQYMDYGFLHNRRDKTSPHEKKIIQDMQLLCAMGWTGGARSELSKRLLSRFNVLHFTFPSDSTVFV
jgi:dynein heavy chain